MLNHLLTFLIFILIGIEIREGLANLKAALLPSLAALGGMIFPALIFIAIASERSAWAVVMPTDIALAIGALSLLGKRVNPAVRLFLMTLAVADDFFSLVVIGIFFRDDLDISSAFYTIGAAVIGALLPHRESALRFIAPVVTFAAIPAYIWLNLFAHFDLSSMATSTSISIAIARVVGKVVGITLTTWLLIKILKLELPRGLRIQEVMGIGLLAGMGMTVSLVIAEITISSESTMNQIRSGLFISAMISGVLGVLWLKRFPVAQ